jgi:hypothetical protein
MQLSVLAQSAVCLGRTLTSNGSFVDLAQLHMCGLEEERYNPMSTSHQEEP